MLISHYSLLVYITSNLFLQTCNKDWCHNLYDICRNAVNNNSFILDIFYSVVYSQGELLHSWYIVRATGQRFGGVQGDVIFHCNITVCFNSSPSSQHHSRYTTRRKWDNWAVIETKSFAKHAVVVIKCVAVPTLSRQLNEHSTIATEPFVWPLYGLTSLLRIEARVVILCNKLQDQSKNKRERNDG